MGQMVGGFFSIILFCYLIYSVNQSDPIIVENLFLGFMLFLSIGSFLTGISIVRKRYKTKKYGQKGVAVLVNLEHTGRSFADDERDEVNYYDAIFLVLEETGKCNFYRLDVGSCVAGLVIGGYFDVAYYKNYIVPRSRLSKQDIPSEKLQALEEAMIASEGKYSV